jgi:hypothetical protein
MAIDQKQLIHEVIEILEETFERHHGIFLDKGTSLFQTLEEIDHDQASRLIGSGCATLAAQVAHVTFYMEVLERYLVANDQSRADWGEIWRTVSAVTPQEWAGLKAKLALTYRRVRGELEAAQSWESDPHLATALAITVHTAYHLGEIRQALCTLR